MTKFKVGKPTYDINKSWDYNYEHGPIFKGSYPDMPKEPKWKFLGHKLISPLGIAAGPLPNSKWIIPYAKLGYGSLIFKTVRSSAHKTHPFPNILFLQVKGKADLVSGKKIVGTPTLSKTIQKLTITNSFGNPCRDPKTWMSEIKKSKKAMKRGQLLGVSVYGTADKNTTLSKLAADFAKTAKLAKKAGATFIEANLACPNVKGAENPNLYKDSKAVKKIVEGIKKSIGKTPLVLKFGYFEKYQDLINVLKPIKNKFEAIAAINTISRGIVDKGGKQVLPGRDESGVCGYAIKDFGIETVKNLARARQDLKINFEIIGVGGVMKPQDVLEYLDAGASHVHSATAVIWNPYLAYDLQIFLKTKGYK